VAALRGYACQHPAARQLISRLPNCPMEVAVKCGNGSPVCKVDLVPQCVLPTCSKSMSALYPVLCLLPTDQVPMIPMQTARTQMSAVTYSDSPQMVAR
jgi:hypothetical protein